MLTLDELKVKVSECEIEYVGDSFPNERRTFLITINESVRSKNLMDQSYSYDTIEDAYIEYVDFINNIKLLVSNSDEKSVELWLIVGDNIDCVDLVGENYTVEYQEEDYGKIRIEYIQETDYDYIEELEFVLIDNITSYSCDSGTTKYRVYDDKQEAIENILCLPRNITEDEILNVFEKCLPNYQDIEIPYTPPDNILIIPKSGQDYLISQLKNIKNPFLKDKEYYDRCVELLTGGIIKRIYDTSFYDTYQPIGRIMDEINIVINSDMDEINFGRIIWISEINNEEYNRMATINNIINS